MNSPILQPVTNQPVVTPATAMSPMEVLGLGSPAVAPEIAVEQTVTLDPSDIESVKFNITIPDSIEPPLADPGKWTLRLYSGECVDCDALIENAENEGTKKKCHFDNGNTSCPAASVAIVYIGAKVKALKLMTRKREQAQQEGDPAIFFDAFEKLRQTQDATVVAYVVKELGIL